MKYVQHSVIKRHSNVLVKRRDDSLIFLLKKQPFVNTRKLDQIICNITALLDGSGTYNKMCFLLQTRKKSTSFSKHELRNKM